VGRAVAFILMTIMLAILATPSLPEDATPSNPAFSPWTKLCIKGRDGMQICLIGRDVTRIGRDGVTACGPVGAAVLIERNSDATKTLRVTLPANLAQQPGVRITIDRNQSVSRPYVRCYANGCVADYEAGAELVAQLRQGETLLTEGTDAAGRPVAVALPLTGFAEAYDGPSAEPQVFEAQSRRLSLQTLEQQAEEVRKQEEEARRRLLDIQCSTTP
jgi:invasion protein IalB